MSEGLRLAGQVLQRAISLRDGIEGAMARAQLSDFVEAVNAMLGGKAVTRYTCEAMVAAQVFKTLDDVMAEAGLEIASEADEASADPDSDLSGEETPPDPERILGPLRAEKQDLCGARDEVRESLARLEWIAQSQPPQSALPAGLASLTLLFVVFVVCLFFFMRDQRVLAVSILILVAAVGLVLFYCEVSAARARQAERDRKEARRKREIAERRAELDRLAEAIAELEQRIEAESVRLGLSPPS